jgi:large subunit ribosomal protein L4
MAVVDVINQNGEKVDSIELDDNVFNADVKDHLVQQVVVWQLAKRRQGNASTKTRGEVSGGGKKPWRQKGTGRARSGSNRSPVWTGGGVVFGPHPRSYAFSLPKKVRKAALRSVLTSRRLAHRLTVVDAIEFDEPKTKTFVQICKNIGVEGQKVLFVTPIKDEALVRSSRNVHRCLVLPCEGLNVYDMLRFERLVVLRSAVSKIHERLS